MGGLDNNLSGVSQLLCRSFTTDSPCRGYSSLFIRRYEYPSSSVRRVVSRAPVRGDHLGGGQCDTSAIAGARAVFRIRRGGSVRSGSAAGSIVTSPAAAGNSGAAIADTASTPTRARTSRRIGSRAAAGSAAGRHSGKRHSVSRSIRASEPKQSGITIRLWRSCAIIQSRKQWRSGHAICRRA